MTDRPETDDALSFDRAIPVTPVSVGGSGGVTCASCRRPITDSYHTANGEPVCDACRAVLALAAFVAWPRRPAATPTDPPRASGFVAAPEDIPPPEPTTPAPPPETATATPKATTAPKPATSAKPKASGAR